MGLCSSQPAAAGCSLNSPMREHGGWGARRYVALYGGACYDRTRRSSRPCYARRLNFHVRLVCAHSPNSPAGVASTPFWGGGGWGGTSASPYWAKSASAWSYFAVAAACSRFASRIASLACSTASSALRFSLLAAQPRQRSLSLASLRSSPTLRGGIEHRTLRCCNFNSVLLLPLPLCAGQALAAWA